MNTNPKAKRILCYGDSNTWGWVPGKMGNKRFPIDKRWPGILQTFLGNSYEVIEEGLGARTTQFHDPRPELPQRNGLESLPIVLETHLPLDLVILMLGTTDTKEMFGVSPEKISEGLKKLIHTIKDFKVLESTPSPKILIVVPPIVKEDTNFASKLFTGGTAKGNTLKKLYAQVAIDNDCLFLDPTSECPVDENEGVHLTEKSHKKLAEMTFEKIESARI
ncbi:MAG: SGNH/GDSL hydrolase family protein [Candidatus Dojkabacteria bacterium]|jgi:lysophospholipase L1-like esterase|nr:SGNH/GDSL hydrolase family protein [Candidatus Dojkabacteria bacterium]